MDVARWYSKSGKILKDSSGDKISNYIESATAVAAAAEVYRFFAMSFRASVAK